MQRELKKVEFKDLVSEFYDSNERLCDLDSLFNSACGIAWYDDDELQSDYSANNTQTVEDLILENSISIEDIFVIVIDGKMVECELETSFKMEVL